MVYVFLKMASGYQRKTDTIIPLGYCETYEGIESLLFPVSSGPVSAVGQLLSSVYTHDWFLLRGGWLGSGVASTVDVCS